jgi:hypothetical protein
MWRPPCQIRRVPTGQTWHRTGAEMGPRWTVPGREKCAGLVVGSPRIPPTDARPAHLFAAPFPVVFPRARIRSPSTDSRLAVPLRTGHHHGHCTDGEYFDQALSQQGLISVAVRLPQPVSRRIPPYGLSPAVIPAGRRLRRHRPGGRGRHVRTGSLRGVGGSAADAALPPRSASGLVVAVLFRHRCLASWSSTPGHVARHRAISCSERPGDGERTH